MSLPRRLTGPLEKRLLRAAERRARPRVERLEALQRELERTHARYRDEIERLRAGTAADERDADAEQHLGTAPAVEDDDAAPPASDDRRTRRRAASILPPRLTRAIEKRLVREAKERVRIKAVQLAALHRELERLQAHQRAEIAPLARGRDAAAAPNPDSRPQLRAVPSLGATDIDLQSVSFEELVELGLSVTQAARFVTSRKRGQLNRISDLDELPGLPNDMRRRLAARLRE